jgi:hypothetical protein
MVSVVYAECHLCLGSQIYKRALIALDHLIWVSHQLEAQSLSVLNELQIIFL